MANTLPLSFSVSDSVLLENSLLPIGEEDDSIEMEKDSVSPSLDTTLDLSALPFDPCNPLLRAAPVSVLAN